MNEKSVETMCADEFCAQLNVRAEFTASNNLNKIYYFY